MRQSIWICCLFLLHVLILLVSFFLQDLISNFLPPLQKINQLQSVVSFISALWIELCFCVPWLFTFLSISLTCGCLFPHRCWKRSRRAPRVPWRTGISTSEGRLNPSLVTLQPTPPCRNSAETGNDCLSRGGYKSAPRKLALKLLCEILQSMSHCSFPLISPLLF